MEPIPEEIVIRALPVKDDRYGWRKLKTGLFAIACILLLLPQAQAFNGDDDIQPSSVPMIQPRPNVSVMRVAQSDDAVFKVNQLEEHIRRLNGQIEELNFQLLQMQEQMRKMQEDNEFRFQELEGKKQGNLGRKSTKQLADNKKKEDASPGKSLPSETTIANRDSDVKQKNKAKPRMIDGVEIYDGNTSENAEGDREVPLGTITFDSLGNVVETALGKPLDLTGRSPDANSKNEQNTTIDVQARISSAASARELYEIGYNYFQAGDYSNSKEVFNAFAENYPDDEKIPNAKFWLGESMFLQSNFEGAAKVFLDAHTNWPNAAIAPQTLLKLGISLAGMEQRELACATYAKVFKKYPNMNNTLKKRVGEEQRSAKCLNG